MSRINFSQEQKLLHHLILHANDTPAAIGLLNGKTGIMLVLAHYSRVRKLKIIEKIADFLMENILNNLTLITPVGFANGLAGIGWAIEYLIQNGYMKGCGLDFCEEIDRKLMEKDVRRIDDITLKEGLEGFLHYVIAHIQGAAVQKRLAFDKSYLQDWQNKLAALRKQNLMSPSLDLLTSQFESVLQGNFQSYVFNLRQFIQPLKKTPFKALGLRNGLAGYIELQLEERQHEKSLYCR